MKRQAFIATSTEIRILLVMLAKLTRQEYQDHLDSCGVGLSTLHLGVLRLLKHHPYTIKELSKHMLVEPASLVPVVDELERQSYAQRTTDPNDRRRTPLVLTQQGDELLSNLPYMSATSAFLKTLRAMGDDKMFDLLVRLRELATGMSGDPERIAEISHTVHIQVSRKSLASAKKTKRQILN